MRRGKRPLPWRRRSDDDGVWRKTGQRLQNCFVTVSFALQLCPPSQAQKHHPSVRDVSMSPECSHLHGDSIAEQEEEPVLLLDPQPMPLGRGT